jgi:hypothetical protein
MREGWREGIPLRNAGGRKSNSARASAFDVIMVTALESLSFAYSVATPLFQLRGKQGIAAQLRVGFLSLLTGIAHSVRRRCYFWQGVVSMPQASAGIKRLVLRERIQAEEQRMRVIKGGEIIEDDHLQELLTDAKCCWS